MRQVYLSTDDVPFAVAFVPSNAELKRPFVDEQPQADNRKPKYDWTSSKWADLSVDDINLNERIKMLEEAVMDLSSGGVDDGVS